jgi:non-ribosomal peptide synthetase component F
LPIRTGIGELEQRPDEERAIFEFNDTAADYPREKTIADLFEAEVAAAPTIRPTGDVELSYRELNRQAISWHGN